MARILSLAFLLATVSTRIPVLFSPPLTDGSNASPFAAPNAVFAIALLRTDVPSPYREVPEGVASVIRDSASIRTIVDALREAEPTPAFETADFALFAFAANANNATNGATLTIDVDSRFSTFRSEAGTFHLGRAGRILHAAFENMATGRASHAEARIRPASPRDPARMRDRLARRGALLLSDESLHHRLSLLIEVTSRTGAVLPSTEETERSAVRLLRETLSAAALPEEVRQVRLSPRAATAVRAKDPPWCAMFEALFLIDPRMDPSELSSCGEAIVRALASKPAHPLFADVRAASLPRPQIRPFGDVSLRLLVPLPHGEWKERGGPEWNAMLRRIEAEIAKER